MSRHIVLVHGAWVTPDFWDALRRRFEAAGFAVHTPAWPGLPPFGSGEEAAAAFRAAPPPAFGRLGVGDIADAHEDFIRRLGGSPILIGHSFGGLLVQLLLDRGVGAAGVALNPAPIRGAIPGPTALRAIAPIVLRPNGWKRPYAFSRARFGRLFANAAPPDLVDEAFARFVIPAPGRIFHQAALGLQTRVRPERRTQPLLISGGDADRLISPRLSRAAFAIQRDAPGRTDYVCFPGRSHFLTHEPGWEEVAGTMLDWIRRLPEPATAPVAPATPAAAVAA
ncbi:alpha/beta hydrolase [Sphingosinicella terrae]|jgi:alpha-beta hydrolase superfamily lysophospholipase|uniref:alpha/beta hydrolase n=1 Tax=Sphingosinicella terrae TaxID=2172047 RepID=UPI000E0DA52A|nr:alpha/beta hydrolase [Sphingosinicella terrae]